MFQLAEVLVTRKMLTVRRRRMELIGWLRLAPGLACFESAGIYDSYGVVQRK